VGWRDREYAKFRKDEWEALVGKGSAQARPSAPRAAPSRPRLPEDEVHGDGPLVGDGGGRATRRLWPRRPMEF
jgi:hypothetical protein